MTKISSPGSQQNFGASQGMDIHQATAREIEASKPDDIPSDVWVLAMNTADKLQPTPVLYQSTIEIISRAIMAVTPSRESSDELAALAARYLGMSEKDFELEFGAYANEELFADIKRLSGSVVSQARGDK